MTEQGMMMTGQNNGDARRVAVGIFSTRTKADATVIALKHLGFTNDEFGVVAKRTEEWEDVTTVGDASEVLSSATSSHQVGGLWTLGMAAIVLPAAGPVVVGGVIGNILATPRVGMNVGGIADILASMGLSEDAANHYYDEVMSGGTLVVVRAGNRYEEVIAVFMDYGGRVRKSDV